MAVSGGKKKRLPPRVELVIETLAEIQRQHADSMQSAESTSGQIAASRTPAVKTGF